jgi:transposase-like protein
MELLKSIQNGRRKKKVSNRSKRYKKGFKVRIVKMFLEESVPVPVICKESGICDGTLHRWVKAYRSSGESGLENRAGSNGRKGLPAPVKEKIVALKKENPFYYLCRDRWWRFPFHR